MSDSEDNSLLKESKIIPDVISIHKLLTARAKEISELENVLTKQSGTKLIFQRLPKHMRRRTMSHNVKRLPRKLQQAHLNQMTKSGLPPKQKRPSRKFRRRPKNLLDNYRRRYRNNAWLETHIWHAKRFHMINHWGYRLPNRPCDKSFRANYRANAHHCLLQDISYISLIELSGPEQVLVNKLKQVTPCENCLSVDAKAYKSGIREGEIVFYHKNKYPFKAIGSVQFMWKPTDSTEDQRVLWLWVHSAYYRELTKVLIELFNLIQIQTFIACEPTYMNNDIHVTLKEFQHYINRFRLTGPLAHSVLMKSLQIAPKNNITPWLIKYFEDNVTHEKFHEKQIDFWNQICLINSQSELSPHIIFNTVVSDPRYRLPVKRTKALQSIEDYSEIINVPIEIKYGPLWQQYLRDDASKTKLSTAEFIIQRSNKLVPSKNVPLEACAVPIMLIQQPGNKDNHLGYCSGWDIVLPLSWGRPFWLCFIMWGARVGGLREYNSLRFEQGIFDLLHPDTTAGQTEEELITEHYKNKYFKLPPNKRINYTKYGIVSPFNYPWKLLIENWLNYKIENFYVLRDRKKLKLLQDLFSNKNSAPSTHLNFNEICLVPVKIELLNRGRIKKYSLICIPEINDLTTMNEPVEQSYKDTNETLRKTLRNNHKKLLKKFKRQRKLTRDEDKISMKVKEERIKRTKLIQEHSSKMRALWLPTATTVRNSCSRQIFGFVTNGDFSFTIAKGQCIGYVVLKALELLATRSKQNNIVLLRDTASKQYRYGKIEFICT